MRRVSGETSRTLPPPGHSVQKLLGPLSANSPRVLGWADALGGRPGSVAGAGPQEEQCAGPPVDHAEISKTVEASEPALAEKAWGLAVASYSSSSASFSDRTCSTAPARPGLSRRR